MMEKKKHPKLKFILLHDSVARKVNTGIFSRTKSEDVNVLKGSLWEDANFKSDSVYSITLHSLEDDNVHLTCLHTDVKNITEEEYQLLLSVSTCQERWNIVDDLRGWLAEGATLQVGHYVHLLKHPGFPEKVICKIEYKGSLGQTNGGTHFGIQIEEPPHIGKLSQATDGVYKKHRYFTCAKNSGLFVTLNKIRALNSSRVNLIDNSGKPNSLPYKQDRRPQSSLPNNGLPISHSSSSRHMQSLSNSRSQNPTSPTFQTASPKVDLRAVDRQPVGRPLPERHQTSKPVASNERNMCHSADKNVSRVPSQAGRGQKSPSLPKRPPQSTKPAHEQADPGQALSAQDQRALAECKLRVGERVVWYSDDGPQHGQVKWLGVLPTENGKTELTAGVDFDNPVGSGTGKFNNEQLFKTEQNHASLIPVIGLIKEAEFDIGANALKQSTPYIDSTYRTWHGSAGTRAHVPTSSAATYPDRYDTFGKQSSSATSVDEDYFRKEQDNLKRFRDERHQIREDQMVSHGKHIEGATRSQQPAAGTVYDGVSSQYKGSDVIRRLPIAGRTAHSLENAPPDNQALEERGAKRKSNSFPRETSPPGAHSPVNMDMYDLVVDSMIEVMGNPPRYGVIRWIGQLPSARSSKPIAGLEMEEESAQYTDGTFGEERYFTCPPCKAFFIYLEKCRHDSRFTDSSRASQIQTFGSVESPDIEGTVSPPSFAHAIDVERRICGRKKGIQGHHNSCYLDASLFSMFAFNEVFDELLYRPKTTDDLPQYDDVQRVLKEGIVNPLRKNFYVRADKVLKLRTLLDKLGNVQGLMCEEKDPEEFLNLLLQQIMKADPFITLSSGENSFFYQLFVEKDETMLMPTTQKLVGVSFLQSNIKLAEVPSCFIVQMPRFGKDYKMYNRIVPSLTLDITAIVESAARMCYICGTEVALYECKTCYEMLHETDSMSFCKSCYKTYHSNPKRAKHKATELDVSQDFLETFKERRKKYPNWEIPREELELFAVVCIETSHYVSFVKCGPQPNAPWVFFDSMADRMGAENGYNIPEVKVVHELPGWLEEKSHDQILSVKDDKQLPEAIRRILCDGYMCMYYSKDAMMYK